MKHKIEISLEIPVMQRMFIGSGFSDNTVNRKVLRDSKGIAYIPASSLKGVIRNQCEKIADLYNFDILSPHDQSLDNFKNSKDSKYITDIIFGSKFEGEKLFFNDAYPEEEAYKNNEIISRNSIDRLMRTSKDSHLFTTEYIRNAKDKDDFVIYKSKIKGYHQNLTGDEIPIEYAFLIVSILSCKFIGGDKSTGAGWIKDGIKINEIKYNNKLFSGDSIKNEFLKEFLNENYEDLKALFEVYKEESRA
ncbi:MAG: RAMP superfamily CRISPR-associated protein [Candidatus Sericytochromatia bacterium]